MAASLARLWLALVRPLWHDEIFTVWISRMEPAALVAALRADSGPPLFYLATRAFVHLSELWSFPDTFVRQLSFLAIAALAFGVRSLETARARAAFLVLAGTFALFSLYSAEARAYALLAALDFALFVELRQRRNDLVHAVLVGVCALAALLTHYLAVFFVAAAALVALSERRWKKLAGLAAGALLALPWLPVLAAQPVAATAWMKESPVVSVAGFFSSLGGVGRIPPAFGAGVPAPLVWLGSAVGLALAGALAAVSRRDADVRSGALVVAVTLAGALAAGFVRPVAFAGRTEMAVLPVWIWVVARAADRDRAVRWIAAAAALAGTAAFAIALPRMAEAPEPAPSRVAAVLEKSAGPDDLVVAGTAFYLPLRLAKDRGALRAELAAFPSELEGHPGWFVPQPAPPAAYGELEERLARRPAGSRAWIVLHPLYLTARLKEVLEAGGSIQPALGASDASVVVWTARGR